MSDFNNARPLRPKLSTTLPRSFQFRYTEGEPPRTPEPESRDQATPEPPEAPHQRLRIKRRRQPYPTVALEPPSDIPLPTIETPDLPSEPFRYVPEPTPEPLEGYLAPTSLRNLISPPKTPIGQIRAPIGIDQVQGDWDMSDLRMRGESIVRPLSACSGMSDSSVSSRGSLASFPSFGGSCTSPESDAPEPFKFPCPQSPTAMLFSPQLQEQSPPMQYIKRKIVWTQEMDDHLLYTYMKLSQDPLITPFKSLPGTAPPLGICSQVAREARRTWKPSRPANTRSCSSTTITGASEAFDSLHSCLRSGSETPTGPSTAKSTVPWPAKNKEGRKRLRELCKRKPSLSAHYSRLMKMRSPSPFASSSSGPAEAPQANNLSSSVSTRDLQISLATSAASTMQPGNPLSQLASEGSSRTSRAGSPLAQPSGRLSAHQKSQSLHIATGIGSYHRHSAPRQLASPFVARPMYSSLRSHAAPSESRPNDHPLPKLLHSQSELRAPMPMPRSFKRRALHHILRDDDESKNYLKQLFGDPAETSDRRVRDRGFSLGDMGTGARRLASVFVPPQIDEPMQTEPTDAPTLNTSLLAQPAAENIPRLRSPFSPKGNQFNTFPRLMAAPNIEDGDPFGSRLGGRGSSSLSRAFLQHQR